MAVGSSPSYTEYELGKEMIQPSQSKSSAAKAASTGVTSPGSQPSAPAQSSSIADLGQVVLAKASALADYFFAIAAPSRTRSATKADEGQDYVHLVPS